MSSLIWPIPCPDDRRELWRGARMIAAEGRKAGVHLALALQDPTHKSLDLRIRRNCLPLSFRIKDGDASRVILGAGDAEQLPPRQFMTVMDRLLRGVAFAPSDEEIRDFLVARPVTPCPVPEWLAVDTTSSSTISPTYPFIGPEPVVSGRTGSELVSSGSEPAEPAVSAEPIPEPVPEPPLPFPSDRSPTSAEQAYMRRLYASGMRKNAVCLQVYGFKNGRTYAWVTAAVETR